MGTKKEVGEGPNYVTAAHHVPSATPGGFTDTGRGKSRLAVMSIQNSLFLNYYLLIIVLFST